jgi:hypothetical protein
LGRLKAGLEDVGPGYVEVLEDVLLHLLGGGGREGDHGHALDLVEDGAQAAVFGSEVMAPFADAMGLIDGEEADGDLREELHVLFLGEGFRGHVEQLGDARADVGAHLLGIATGEGAVEEVGHAVLPAEAAQQVHLVLHQGDQGAHHDGGALAHQGGQLVAEALATAGGHDHEGVAAIEHALDDRLLIALELGETEELFEGLPW